MRGKRTKTSGLNGQLSESTEIFPRSFSGERQLASSCSLVVWLERVYSPLAVFQVDACTIRALALQKKEKNPQTVRAHTAVSYLCRLVNYW